MTEKVPASQRIGDVVERVTARLDASRILRAYIRQLSAVVDQQEGLAREEVVQAFGDEGDALFRSVRDIHYRTAEDSLPDMASILAVPGMADLVEPPWWPGLVHAQMPELVPEAPEFDQEAEEPTPGEDDGAPIAPVLPQETAPKAEEPRRPPPAQEPPLSAPGGTVLYGIEIEPANVSAAHRIIEEARLAVASGLPEAFFAYDKRVGRHQWRKTLYQQVFRDEAAEAGISLPQHPGGAGPETEFHVQPAGPPVAEAAADAYGGVEGAGMESAEDDMVFGDVEGVETAAAAEDPGLADLPAFLLEEETGPVDEDAGRPKDAFGEPTEQPVESWLRPFGTEGEPAGEQPDEGRVVQFAPPRPVPRPIKMAPGLGRRPPG